TSCISCRSERQSHSGSFFVRRSAFCVRWSTQHDERRTQHDERRTTNDERRVQRIQMSTKGTLIPDWLAVPFAGITPAPSQQKGQDLFPTGNWRAIRPVYRDKMPSCNNACGTNGKIQGYLDLVKLGKCLDAYAPLKWA